MMKASRTPKPLAVPDARKRMKRKRYAYVRAHRRRWGLTQRELGWLVGLSSRTAVSRIEMSKRKPTTETVIACAIVFDLPLDAIFPGLHEEIERGVFRRATELREQLGNQTNELSLRKCVLLDEVLARIIKRSQQLLP